MQTNKKQVLLFDSIKLWNFLVDTVRGNVEQKLILVRPRLNVFPNAFNYLALL